MSLAAIGLQPQPAWKQATEYILGSAAFVKLIEWLTFYMQMYNAKFLTLFTLTIIRSLVGSAKAKRENRYSKRVLWQDTYDAFFQLVWIFSGIRLLVYIEPSAASAENYLYAMYGWLLFKSIAEDATMKKFKDKMTEFLKINVPKGCDTSDK